MKTIVQLLKAYSDDWHRLLVIFVLMCEWYSILIVKRRCMVYLPEKSFWLFYDIFYVWKCLNDVKKIFKFN